MREFVREKVCAEEGLVRRFVRNSSETHEEFREQTREQTREKDREQLVRMPPTSKDRINVILMTPR